jgi:hypothetical protein
MMADNPAGDFLKGLGIDQLTRRAEQEAHNERVKFLAERAKANKAAKEAEEKDEQGEGE